MLNFRGNKLKSLLIELDKFRNIAPTNKTQSFDYFEILLLVLLTIAEFYGLFINDWTVFVYCIPPTMGCFDHLFLNEILKRFRNYFNTINAKLEKEATSIDLNKLFPLTKIDKIKKLEEVETHFQIRCIQDLALLRHDLVDLVLEINKIFSTITIASMVIWFSCTVDLIYLMINMLVHSGQTDFLEFWFPVVIIFLFVLWLLVMVRMYSRTQQSVKV
ncbi:gustatory receptor 140 [Tribolium castaneum]|uniref:Gustatory receptor 140 n=1 Tax=Tribolium castaneum TaxID=7070 RepID=D6WIN3_TRICA|nr:gustatory receptor 140 [Tribolium castaneum]